MLLLSEPEVYERDCGCCGKRFSAVRRFITQAYRESCSPSCAAQLTVQRRKSGEFTNKQQESTCPECGNAFTAKWIRSQKRFQKFCSSSCVYRANGKLGKDDSWERQKQVKCEICGNMFLATRRSKKSKFARVCSYECSGKLRRTRLKRQCMYCGKIFRQIRSVVERNKRGGSFCSQECYHAHGYAERIVGRKIEHGYIRVYAPDHPFSKGKSGYLFEHRLVMENMLGRALVKGESVHHIDGNRANNAPENLELWGRGQPAGQRMKDLYRSDMERLARENYQLKQRIAELESALRLRRA